MRSLECKAGHEVSGRIGSAVMACFAFAALLRWQEHRDLFFVLLAFRDLLAAYFLIIRKPAIKTCSGSEAVLAYASSALPLCYSRWDSIIAPLVAFVVQLLAIWGFLISTLATIELGDQMGVSPAYRGPKRRTGIYCYLKHPMYFGYAIAELGWILVNPINGIIFTISMMGYILRCRLEDRFSE